MRLFCILLAYLHVLSCAGSETHLGNETASARSFSTHYHIYVRNSCHKKVRIAIVYYKQTMWNVGWVARCWWEFSPGSSAYLSEQGDRLQTEKGHWYVYAEEVNDTDGNVSQVEDATTCEPSRRPNDWEAIGTDYKWEGDYNSYSYYSTRCKGRDLNMRRWSHMDSGDLSLRLTCFKINDLIEDVGEPNELVP
mmetsp:Transcript_11697/g.13722  ORF Transcript_11697/g.13722 Transcript_11697/m.13722 type:complete len:193 (-) Transcript_11697:248-826(-)